ncbi:hypothetical protein Ssi03_24110 [Sphaerisporangium siamense]|uniref:Uncharacterized protein n=2 Tax=Sphaerisporangium TaxID=321315 RepID=A0A7W8Z6N7_9ACTN|nr:MULTISPECIES: hypothetical protein [Sphaerisporangium]MBB4701675.1 hypothetical protein [Sphaerisporangium siamense]MBB5628215.1 hypothetical protein [Sphaerisporangium krabiense]GII66210.1 hypothetical protein Skr01_62950 [Sphaerisporangium krabiense]GII84421.1 hypothetical protein Ssi03_24110 [Sphaerisporangium siamense]
MAEVMLADSKLARFVAMLARAAETRPDTTPTLPPVKVSEPATDLNG